MAERLFGETDWLLASYRATSETGEGSTTPYPRRLVNAWARPTETESGETISALKGRDRSHFNLNLVSVGVEAKGDARTLAQ